MFMHIAVNAAALLATAFSIRIRSFRQTLSFSCQQGYRLVLPVTLAMT
jgi:hypothetical protein